MKKLIQVAVALVVGVSVFGGVASAAEANCSLSNTGPNSNNQCDFTANQTCKVKNNTLVSIGNTTVQDANSGQAVVNGNTNSGSATSGDATNNNSNDTQVGVTNGSACVVTTVATPTPAGGKGAAEAPAAAAPQVSAPKGAVNAGGDSLVSRVSFLGAAMLLVVSAIAAAVRVRSAARL
jgi:hypothetical protein